ncbi:MAG: sugar phosphate isomerase/epimerase [Bacteroidaceae bacterium]|nr:sugar phosphate isomerase/epimerase [Bacteroidaceae bacterium]
MDRRNFLKGASMLSLGALAACNNEKAAAPAVNVEVNNPDKYFGLQIYTLGNELYAGNLSDNLKKLRNMGIKYIELAGYDVNTNTVGGVDFTEFKKQANDAGLEIPSSHVNAPGLFSGVAGRESRDGSDGQFNRSMINKVADSFKKVAEDHAKQGIQYVVHPMMAYLNNEDDVKAFAEMLNKSGEIFKAAGIQFGYHHHNMEFARMVKGVAGFRLPTVLTPLTAADGPMIMDMLMDNTDPANVCYEMDTYWTVMGQQDPVVWLKNRASRIKLMHVKDFVVLGASGAMNFKNIFEQFYANGNKYLFVEIEDIDSGKQMARVEESMKFINSQPYVK